MQRLYAEQGSRWACDVRVSSLAYLAKHDRDATIPLVHDAAAADPECAELIEKHPQLRDLKIEIEEEVIVTAMRTGGRSRTTHPRRGPGQGGVEEKMMMTPGDIVMMLNEMGGLRVQTTSPCSAPPSVRIQGMRGATRAFSPTVCRSSASRSADSVCCRFRRWISDRSK